jgi:hypothetical protein
VENTGLDEIKLLVESEAFQKGDSITILDKEKGQLDTLIDPGQNNWYRFEFPEDGENWAITATAVNSPSIDGAETSFSGSIGFGQNDNICPPSNVRFEVSMSASTDDQISKNCILKAGKIAWFQVTGSEFENKVMGYRLAWDMFSY